MLGAAPGVLELARAYVAMLRSLGDVQVIVQKTRLVCVARVRFAGLIPRKHGFQATFALHRWLDSPRVVKRVDYGPRWRGHHVSIQANTDLDDELRGWLQEAHDVVGLQAGLADGTGRRPRASPAIDATLGRAAGEPSTVRRFSSAHPCGSTTRATPPRRSWVRPRAGCRLPSGVAGELQGAPNLIEVVVSQLGG